MNTWLLQHRILPCTESLTRLDLVPIIGGRNQAAYAGKFKIGTCKTTFARSTGAAINVWGIAEKKPAAVISSVLSVLSFLSGVAAITSFFPRS